MAADKKIVTGFQPKPSNLTALPFRMPGITSGLKPASSESFIQRSGVNPHIGLVRGHAQGLVLQLLKKIYT